MNACEVIDRAGCDGNVDGDLSWQLFGGSTGEPNLRWAELQMEMAFLEIARADLLGEKNINSQARIGLAAKFAEMRLDGAVFGEGGVAKFDGENLERGAFDGEFLDVTFADWILHDLMHNGDFEFAAGEKRFDGVRGVFHERARLGESAIVGRILDADGGGEFGVVEPRDVVEERGEEGVFFDMEIYSDLIATRVEVVFDVSKEAGVDEFVGSGLERIAGYLGARLKFSEGDDLSFGEFFEAVGVNFAESGIAGGGSLRLRGSIEGKYEECARRGYAQNLSTEGH